MPQGVTPVDRNDIALNLQTSVSDGDAASGTNFLVAVQALANSVNWLNNRLALGVLADLTALKALVPAGSGAQPALLNGEKRFVTGYGIYEWKASDTAAESLPWIAQPTTAGNGRWYHQESTLKGANSGLATLDSSGRLVQVPKFGMVARGSAVYTATGQIVTTSGSYADLGGSSPQVVIASGVAVGDIVRIRGTTWMVANGGTATGLRLVIIDGASTITPAELTWGGIPTASQVRSWAVDYVVANGPNITVKWQGNATGATNVGIGTDGTNTPSHLAVDIIRP